MERRKDNVVGGKEKLTETKTGIKKYHPNKTKKKTKVDREWRRQEEKQIFIHTQKQVKAKTYTDRQIERQVEKKLSRKPIKNTGSDRRKGKK